jgi:hypothetical protein
MSSRSTDIIFLLGAGASVEADIPMSAAMIGQIENLMKTHEDWIPFTELYNHVKTAIHYSAGLKGVFGDRVPYNIETLVNTLYELERNEEHPLYPFIASWNSRFVALARSDFAEIRKFRRMILRELKRWMSPDDTSKGDYYRGFATLQKDLNFPLHVFSLNYDRCVERVSDKDFTVETGFNGHGPDNLWDWERFEQGEGGPDQLPQMYLYKIHGSINWKRNEGKNLYCVEQTENVAHDAMEIIFGRHFKLEAADPYLFYAYQFRRCTLSAKLIVAIGYSFADDHINKMIIQGLMREPSRRLMVVSYCLDENACASKREEVAILLGVCESQILVFQGTAKSFLEKADIGEYLRRSVPQPEDSPF